MRTYPGNYLGLVINTEDPEQRGRVQVFIPNVSTTLYKSWNERLEDINFRSFTNPPFTDEITERLKSLLPWAEAAVPFWGGGTGGPINESTGSPVPVPTDAPINEEVSESQNEPPLPPVGGANPPPSISVSGGANTSPTTTSGSNIPIPDAATEEPRQVQKKDGLNNDEGAIAPETRPVSDGSILSYSDGGSGSLPYDRTYEVEGDGPLSSTKPLRIILHDSHDDVGSIPNWLRNGTIGGNPGKGTYNYIVTNGKIYSTVREGTTSYYGVRGANSNSISIAWIGKVGSKPNAADQAALGKIISYVSAKNNIPISRIGTHGEVQDDKPANEASWAPQVLASLGAGYSGIADGGGTVNDGVNVQHKTDMAMMTTGSADVGRYGSPMGYFSIPAVGSKVWVFFEAENPQFPVYFANAYEPSNVKSVDPRSTEVEVEPVSNNNIEPLDPLPEPDLTLDIPDDANDIDPDEVEQLPPPSPEQPPEPLPPPSSGNPDATA